MPAQLELELPEAAAPERGQPRSRQGPAKRGAEPSRARRRLRLWAALVILVLAAAAAAFAVYQVDGFLASDPRFALGGEAGLRLEGAVHVNPNKLREVFARDFGRSVYLIPLERRRRELLGVDWVGEARVERHWPNRMVVRIAERTPVAFVVLPPAGGLPARTALIDAAGVILEAPQRARYEFPVLLGLSEAQPAAARRARVEQFLRFQRDAGAFAGRVSEVDLGDPENLKVTALMDGVPVRLWLGDENFRARLDNFLGNYAEIRRRLPYAAVFDLRLERHITAMKGGGGVR